MTTAIAQKNKKVWLIGGLIVSTLAIIGIFSMRILNWYNTLSINFSGKISGYKDGNILLKCKAVLDNPKNFEMTITKPTIRIYSGTTLLANSEPSSEKIKIIKNGLTSIDYIIKVPLLSGELAKVLLQIGKNIPNLINSLTSGTPISLGINLDVNAYMQLPGGINRTWKQKMSI